TFESVIDFPVQFDVAPKYSETGSGVGVCPIHELHMQMRYRRVPGISYLCDLVTYFNPHTWPNNDRALPEVGIRREGSIVVPDDDVVSKQGANTELGPQKPFDRYHECNGLPCVSSSVVATFDAGLNDCSWSEWLNIGAEGRKFCGRGASQRILHHGWSIRSAWPDNIDCGVLPEPTRSVTRQSLSGTVQRDPITTNWSHHLERSVWA